MSFELIERSINAERYLQFLHHQFNAIIDELPLPLWGYFAKSLPAKAVSRYWSFGEDYLRNIPENYSRYVNELRYYGNRTINCLEGEGDYVDVTLKCLKIKLYLFLLILY